MPGTCLAAQGSGVPPEGDLGRRLAVHVQRLAGEIGERNLWRPRQLEQAAAAIEASWGAMGYAVNRQEYRVNGQAVANLEVLIPGSGSGEIIVVGAHYDSVRGSPGANDNASGVAALLELARLFRQSRPTRELRFVAFANEEPPFFLTSDMGSRVYARQARQRGEAIRAMVSLETIGYFNDTPGSQRYPFPLGFLYPSQANFIGIVGNLGSRHLVRQAAKAFRQGSSFPMEKVAAPGIMTGIGWSDHWSFWREGYQAIMITDTALFRYDPYHTSTDTPDKLVYDRMAAVVLGIGKVIEDLAETGPAGMTWGQAP